LDRSPQINLNFFLLTSHMSSNTVHQTAAVGFNKDAGLYDRARPSYPQKAVEQMAKTCHITPQSRILDVAAGTGKFTTMLVERGYNVTALEPVEAMRQVLRQKLPQIEILDGAATQIQLPDASIDVITIAQAFHWFANKDSLKEFHRVLKPNGYLVLIWNSKDEAVPWVEDIVVYMWNYKPKDTPQYRDNKWQSAFADQDLFGDLRYTAYSNNNTHSRQDIIDRVFSTSFISKQPEDVAVKIKADLNAIMDRYSITMKPEDTTVYPYRTDLFVAQALPK
jgi:ubiquinone/menaquinone biosynthesis C-methylase UbiE